MTRTQRREERRIQAVNEAYNHLIEAGRLAVYKHESPEYNAICNAQTSVENVLWFLRSRRAKSQS